MRGQSGHNLHWFNLFKGCFTWYYFILELFSIIIIIILCPFSKICLSTVSWHCNTTEVIGIWIVFSSFWGNNHIFHLSTDVDCRRYRKQLPSSQPTHWKYQVTPPFTWLLTTWAPRSLQRFLFFCWDLASLMPDWPTVYKRNVNFE